MTVLSLPNEILQHIASFLEPLDLRACNSSCHQFSHICRDYKLWRKFFVNINTSCPIGRLCHTGVVYKDSMFVFGGHITQPASEYFHSVKHDLHECNLVTRTWTEHGAEGAPRRTEHTAVVYNDSMIVFGGYSGNGYECSVMVFDFKGQTWTQLATHGDPPSARSAHTAVMVGDSMYVFGGWNGVNCMNDLHVLHVPSATWRQVSANNAAARVGDPIMPTARCSHGAVVLPSGNGDSHVMYVFGGYAIEGSNDSPNKGYLDDLYEYHFEEAQWRKSKATGSGPCARSRFRMIGHAGSLYLFAGWNSTKHFNTLHRYCTVTKRWTEVETNFPGDGIGQFSMVEHAGIMYIFSGFAPSIQAARTSLYAYPLAPAGQAM